jgi:putative NADH-flavin reductase
MEIASVKLTIFGATGKTGIEVVKQALAQGHEVTAFVREASKTKLDPEKIDGADRLRIVCGDVYALAEVKQALRGQEAVVCSLGSSSLTKTTVRAEGTANIVKAMEVEQVGRLIVVSAMGTGESWPTLSFMNRLFYATLLRSSRQDHEAQEAVVKESSLNWTIVRPSGLTDDPIPCHR